jgi:hypothetical protein
VSVTHDIIAINERGVYAICYDEPGDEYVAEFTREALAAGNRVERVTTKEACERHLAYLKTLPAFAGVF